MTYTKFQVGDLIKHKNYDIIGVVIECHTNNDWIGKLDTYKMFILRNTHYPKDKRIISTIYLNQYNNDWVKIS